MLLIIPLTPFTIICNFGLMAVFSPTNQSDFVLVRIKRYFAPKPHLYAMA
jgi:hypothetical protein